MLLLHANISQKGNNNSKNMLTVLVNSKGS